jgi:preprotein translocase subunit SecB
MTKKKEAHKANRDGPTELPSTKVDPSNSNPLTELKLLGQYIKNLSFESPRASNFVESLGLKPQLQTSVDVHVADQSGDSYEVTLNLEIRATGEAGIIYHLELAYAGLFRLCNVPSALLQAVLFADCPKILFPDLRRVVSDITRDGGFPPLMLDFGRLPVLARGKI